MVLRHKGFRDSVILTSSVIVKVTVGLSCSLPKLQGVSGMPKSLLCTTLYSMNKCSSIFVCVRETASWNSPGNRRPQQTQRADSSIWNPIIGNQEDNLSTQLKASSLCWTWPRGKRVCQNKMKNWWVKYDLHLIYCTFLSSELEGWLTSLQNLFFLSISQFLLVISDFWGFQLRFLE